MPTIASTKWSRPNCLGAWALLPLVLALARPAGAIESCYQKPCVVTSDHVQTNNCEPNEVCKNGSYCVPLCNGNLCQDNEICGDDGACKPQECTSNAECDAGLCRQCRCTVSECVADAGCGCTSNDDCNPGLACSVSGFCEPAVEVKQASGFACALGEGAAGGPSAVAVALIASAAAAARRRLQKR